MDKSIILGCGPSLCQADATTALGSGWPVIAVNDAWRMAPGCDVIYAGDLEWWTRYYAAASETGAALWTCHSRAAPRFGLNRHLATGPYNSGQRAIQFAASQGARIIVLLGFDCSIRHGLHWHGPHPTGMSNPGVRSILRWHQHFDQLPSELPGVNIINCSRYTEITAFGRLELAEALSQFSHREEEHA